MKKEWSQQQIRDYLLGRLPAEETEQLDELFVTNDELALRLQTVEYDLVDSYVRGRLGESDLDPFEKRYLSYPNDRKKIGNARIIQKLLEQKEKERKEPLFPARKTFSPWLSAAAILLLLIIGYLVFQNVGLRRDASRQWAELHALRERESELQKQLAGNGKKQKPEKLAGLDLRPATRGVREVPSLEVPTTADWVLFTLPLETIRYPTYKVELRDPGTNHLLWQGDPLNAAKTVQIRVPAAVLGTQHYQFQLFGISNAGGMEFVAGYPVTIIRK